MNNNQIGSRVLDINSVVDIFEAQEGEIYHIIGKTGNGKTYEGTRRALEYLKAGYVVYTTWQLIIPEKYDERKKLSSLLAGLFFFKKRYYVFDYKKNWRFLDIDRPDLVDYVASLTDCVVMLDEGQDIFDSYEGRGMSKEKRKTLTRTRHMRKTLVIISQRAQAVAVTARANVTFFYKCIRTRAWFYPFINYFKVYRTEDMDDNNFPDWDESILWRSHFAKKEIYNAFNSWYLRAGIERSQTVRIEAYDLTFVERIKAIYYFLSLKLEKDNIFGPNSKDYPKSVFLEKLKGQYQDTREKAVNIEE